MSNAKKAMKKITAPNAVLYFAACVITALMAISCLGIMGAVGGGITEEGIDERGGLMAVEAFKALFMSVGISLICEGSLRGAKSVSVMPIKRENAAKALCDRILRFSAVPFCTDIIFGLILCSDINSNHSAEFFNNSSKVISLACISLIFTFVFAWLSLLYAGIKRGGEAAPLCIKLGGYYVAAAIVFVIKGLLEYTVITAGNFGFGNLAGYALFALAFAIAHFGAVRRKFSEKFFNES